MFKRAQVLVWGCVACAMVIGCTNKSAVRQAKRDEDRRQLQVEDLTNQRNALQDELNRVREANTGMAREMQELKAKVSQANAEMSALRDQLQSANAAAKNLESQKAELARVKEELGLLKERLSATPAVTPEQRTVTPPATGPATRPTGAANK